MLEQNKTKSRVLKIALFATGLSGIVAEYVLSTLASYFIGNPVLQFTLIVSLMLFSMGLGSRLSRSLNKNLLEIFIVIEIILSLLVSFSAIAVYTTYVSHHFSWILIYLLSIFVGLLIGLEIPLVTRINDQFEELKVNIASVLEKDYYGSLIGGLFFAFVGLPYLGLTYTPFVLGLINFTVALWLFFKLKDLIKPSFYKKLALAFMLTGAIIIIGFIFAKPIIEYGDQQKYRDRIVYAEQTPYQKIVLTQWNDVYSVFINGNLQLSSFDEYLYHEPLIHPVMQLSSQKERVLLLGGGDGCAVREILKYSDVKSITVVDLDPAMTNLGKDNSILQKINKSSLSNQAVEIHNADAYKFLENSEITYDVIIIDLPDPNNVDLAKLYSKEFYQECNNHLSPGGYIITQAGSPYYATKAFYCIEKSMKSAGFQTLPLQNQVMTMGQWGWILAHKSISKNHIKIDLHNIDFDKLDCRWLNNDAIRVITSFGKPIVDTSGIQLNTIFRPVLHDYYDKGNWEVY